MRWAKPSKKWPEPSSSFESTMSTLPTIPHLIDGKRVAGGSRAQDVFNPATGRAEKWWKKLMDSVRLLREVKGDAKIHTRHVRTHGARHET